MSLLVVAYPEIEQRDYEWIESVRIKYDQENYHAIRPHFTLVFPAEGIVEQDLIDHVEGIVKTMSPIRFVLRGASMIYDQFSNRWYVFLIPNEGISRLTNLHDNLYTGMLADKWLMKIPYIPHVTVALLEDCQECKNLTAEVNREGLTIEGMIRAVDIIRDIEGPVETIKRVGLIGS